MKKSLMVVSCWLLLVCNADDNNQTNTKHNSLLSALKKEKLEIQKKQDNVDNSIKRYDWIEEILGTYDDGSGDNRGDDTDTQSIGISAKQPVFKSGGIYYTIMSANESEKLSILGTMIDEQTLIKNILNALLNIKKYELSIKRQKLLIDNAKIDIMRKKEQYQGGFIDSSFLDEAILDKTTLEKQLIDMQTTKNNYITQFKIHSDEDYNNIKIPKFNLMSQSEYLENSLQIKKQNAQSEYDRFEKNITTSEYLPHVAIKANYNDDREIYQNDADNDSYSYIGLEISMPLFDFNRRKNIETKRLSYLKSKLQLSDTKKEENLNYENTVNTINNLKEKIKIVKKDEELYDSLLLNAKELLSAGERTIHDVQIMQNSKNTMVLDGQIYELDIQLDLLELYAKMKGYI